MRIRGYQMKSLVWEGNSPFLPDNHSNEANWPLVLYHCTLPFSNVKTLVPPTHSYTNLLPLVAVLRKMAKFILYEIRKFFSIKDDRGLLCDVTTTLLLRRYLHDLASVFFLRSWYVSTMVATMCTFNYTFFTLLCSVFVLFSLLCFVLDSLLYFVLFLTHFVSYLSKLMSLRRQNGTPSTDRDSCFQRLMNSAFSLKVI